MPRLPVDNDAITLSPPEQQQQHIDWDRESALAAQSSMAQAAKEKNYRDLSSLTPEQLAWVKKNHVEPMPGFKWDRNRGEMLRHGIIKLNDYCVLIVVIPFCRFGGKIQSKSTAVPSWSPRHERVPRQPNPPVFAAEVRQERLLVAGASAISFSHSRITGHSANRR